MFAKTLLILAVFVYVVLFSVQENNIGQKEPNISIALPAPMQQVALGYLKEFGAELLFIKASVFWGRLDLPEEPEVYASDLAQNFEVMTDLYPEFVDPYYLSQSSLAYIDYVSAERTNKILLKGMEAYPENFVFPYFRGFNLYYYMNHFVEAAEVFKELAARTEAPSWFGHLAGVLSARGGDLYGGLMTLQAMLATESEEVMRLRYQQDIKAFESAIAVYEAVDSFYATRGGYPERLAEIVPDFLPELPSFENGFSIQWDSPNVRLVRPLKKSDAR